MQKHIIIRSFGNCLILSICDIIPRPKREIEDMTSTKATMVSSRTVALNGHEFVVMLNRMDLMKYSTVENKWTLLLLTPYRADEFSMVMNQHTNRLYILMGSIGTPRNCECMKVLGVSTGHVIQHFELQCNPYSTGIERCAIGECEWKYSFELVVTKLIMRSGIKQTEFGTTWRILKVFGIHMASKKMVS